MTRSRARFPSLNLNFRSPVNTTVMTTAIAVLFCPSDPAPIGGPLTSKGTNYRANYGPLVGYGSANEDLSGPFSHWRIASARDVTDGLSHTASYSEKPRGDSSRTVFQGFVDPLLDPKNPDPPARELFEYCANQAIIPANFRTTTGTNWLVGGLTQTWYNHMEVPNGSLPDCLRQGSYPGDARATARSYHATGANVALADGSVRLCDIVDSTQNLASAGNSWWWGGHRG